MLSGGGSESSSRSFLPDLRREGALSRAPIVCFQRRNPQRKRPRAKERACCARKCDGADDSGASHSSQVVDDILDVTATTEQLGKTAGKDLAVNKATYPSLLGLEESRKVADQLTRDAKAELAHFPPHLAAPLLALADYINDRKN